MILTVAILYAVFTGLLTVTLANVHHVQPDNMCHQWLPESCHTLQYFINHSSLSFLSNATFLFVEGEYIHSNGDLIVQSVTNLSLIGTDSASNDSVAPTSVIKCLSLNHIHFNKCG